MNGQFAAGEWQGATRLPLASGAEFLAQRTGGDLLAAVRLPRGNYRYVDLYVRDAEGRTLNLHASFAQGQRVLPPEWDDSRPPFEWRPSTWNSSIAGRTGAPPDAPIADQIGELEGYEMQVPIALLGTSPLAVRLEVRDFEGKGPDWTLPAGSTRSDAATWAPLRLPAACP